MGYVKVSKPVIVNGGATDSDRKPVSSFTAEKSSTGTSWGAVYAQFFQPVTDIQASNSELKVKRELIPVTVDDKKTGANELKVGDKVLVRLTITADRDYDFVQVIDNAPHVLNPQDN